jgi:predicted  nucleic acid-binding Zn-ribbon protein
MSDLGKRAVDAPTNTKTIEQTTALRGWLTALLAQTVQAETTLRYRLADLETEAQRLGTHIEQTTSAIETLRRSIHTVDEAIGRRIRELQASAALDHRSEAAEVESERSGESPEQPVRAERRESRRQRRPGHGG